MAKIIFTHDYLVMQRFILACQSNHSIYMYTCVIGTTGYSALLYDHTHIADSFRITQEGIIIAAKLPFKL